MDLFVANDGEPNYLYRNDGTGHFKDIAFESGVAVSEEGLEQANMGVALGDYLNDGKMSIAISHFSEEYAVLYRNDGGFNFTDVSRQAGIAQPSVLYVGWGDAFVDLTNSGWKDLVLVNGHLYPQVDDAKAGIAYKEPKLVYINQRNGTFREMSAATGKAVLIPQVSRGLAVGDLFHRGVLDIVIENLVSGPMILEPKPNPANHWVSFALEGSPNNRLAAPRKPSPTFSPTIFIRSSRTAISSSQTRRNPPTPRPDPRSYFAAALCPPRGAPLDSLTTSSGCTSMVAGRSSCASFRSSAAAAVLPISFSGCRIVVRLGT